VYTLYLAVNPGVTLFLCSQTRLIKSDVEPVYNVPLRRLAEKCGFILEATLKNYCVDSLSGKPAFESYSDVFCIEDYLDNQLVPYLNDKN